jgi:hypothetical protein
MPASKVILLLSARGASIVKMVSTQVKAFCVHFEKTKFVTNVQWDFHERYLKDLAAV